MLQRASGFGLLRVLWLLWVVGQKRVVGLPCRPLELRVELGFGASRVFKGSWLQTGTKSLRCRV